MSSPGLGMHKKLKLVDHIKAEFAQGNRQKAIDLCQQSSYLNPQNKELKKLLGLLHATVGNLSVAQRSYESALQLDPQDTELIFNLGIIARKLLQYEKAMKYFEECLALKDQSLEVWGSLGEAQLQLKQYEASIVSSEKALLINPQSAPLWNNKAWALKGLGQILSAKEAILQALQIDPQNHLYLNNLAEIWCLTKEIDLALETFTKVTQIQPTFYNAWLNLGIGYLLNHWYRKSIPYFTRAIELEPQNPRAYAHYAKALFSIHEKNLALQQVNRALQLNPQLIEALTVKASMLKDDNFQDLVVIQDKIAELDPQHYGAMGFACHTKLLLGRWQELADIKKQILCEDIDFPQKFWPFNFLTLLDDPEKQKRVTMHHASLRFEFIAHTPMAMTQPNPKIKLAYLSPDFTEHPVTYLITELIELHSRDQFEIYGFSLKEWPQGPAQSRIVNAFDHFVDMGAMSNTEALQCLRGHALHIAIDLCGYTDYGRPELFAHRIAPIQINYLGFLGTMGTHYYDYQIVDKTLVPVKLQKNYSEKLLYLPSYQVNDSKRAHPPKPLNIKQELGLPENALVFGSLNNIYKYNVEVFQVWVNILQQVPQGVLYLLTNVVETEKNFLEFFKEHQIDPARIFFAKRTSREMYLRNYHAIDIFLDTWPYNAGTTASDALWMGVPVITKLGLGLQARMAASLLQAIDLPELITADQQAYATLAIKMALDQDYRQQIVDRLAINRVQSRLFDTPRMRDALEQGFKMAVEQKLLQKPLDHIVVESAL